MPPGKPSNWLVDSAMGTTAGCSKAVSVGGGDGREGDCEVGREDVEWERSSDCLDDRDLPRDRFFFFGTVSASTAAGRGEGRGETWER